MVEKNPREMGFKPLDIFFGDSPKTHGRSPIRRRPPMSTALLASALRRRRLVKMRFVTIRIHLVAAKACRGRVWVGILPKSFAFQGLGCALIRVYIGGYPFQLSFAGRKEVRAVNTAESKQVWQETKLGTMQTSSSGSRSLRFKTQAFHEDSPKLKPVL